MPGGFAATAKRRREKQSRKLYYLAASPKLNPLIVSTASARDEK
jgi:hypothetical protein